MGDETPLLLPQGTLDLLILRTIALEPQHGWAISQRIQLDLERRAARAAGLALPRPPSPRAPRLDQGRVGRLRQQPPRQVLRADAQGTRRARGADERVAQARRSPSARCSTSRSARRTESTHAGRSAISPARALPPPRASNASSTTSCGSISSSTPRSTSARASRARRRCAARAWPSAASIAIEGREPRPAAACARSTSPGAISATPSARWRAARSSPLVAIVSLTLGIGANTAMFQLLNALVLRPLPVAAPQELVEINLPERDLDRGARQLPALSGAAVPALGASSASASRRSRRCSRGPTRGSTSRPRARCGACPASG